MTRDETLAVYRPIRAAIRRILAAATPVCERSDMLRAAKQIGLWDGRKILLPEGESAAEMLSDIALFEPNQRKRRAFDGFLAERARELDDADRQLAERMGRAFFSLFRYWRRHEVAGIWIEDLLDGNRNLWLMDEALEASMPGERVFGLRVFDAGSFHAGFGIVALTDDETTEFSVVAAERGDRLPFRHSLAATLYGDSLRESSPISEDLADVLVSLFAGISATGEGTARKIGAASPRRGSNKRGSK